MNIWGNFVLVSAVCLFGLVGCDSEDLTSSGSGHSTQAVAVSKSPEEQPDGSTSEGVTEPNESVEETENEAPNTELPASGDTDNCGAGHYAFLTDVDGKMHFDAHFDSGGVARYNFSLQPNRGTWRVSGNQMIFDGPFGAGNSHHVFTWAITSRSSDCKIQHFQGKSFGRADMTASRR